MFTGRCFVSSSMLLLLSRNVVQAQPLGCFDVDHLPSCSAPTEGKQLDQSSLQTICSILDNDYLWNIQYGTPLLHAEAMASIPADSQLCHDARQAYHQCYWCTPEVNFPYCMFYTCDKPEEVDESVDVEATCNELVDMFHDNEWPATIDFCHRAEQSKHHCPILCDDTQLDVLGASSEKKKIARVWMSRASAILSFLGAIYILWDSLSKRENRTTVYHQLLIGMACFDIVTAVAWGFATSPIPEDEGFYVQGAQGNVATCTTQGYFVQLGFTSVFYNVSLSVYYLLVIVFGWRESALQSIRRYLHGIPLLIGFALAFAGIPFYDWIEYGCHLEPPPGKPVWETLVFAVLPIGIAIIVITVAMLFLSISVSRRSQASKKWKLVHKEKQSLEKRVFWQAVFYILSFYVTWPILLLVYTTGIDAMKEDGNYVFSMVVAFLAPIQGFCDFLVYVRPRTTMTEVPLVRRASSLISTAFFRRHPTQKNQRTDEELWEDESPLGFVDHHPDPSVLITRVPQDCFPPIPETRTGSHTEADDEQQGEEDQEQPSNFLSPVDMPDNSQTGDFE